MNGTPDYIQNLELHNPLRHLKKVTSYQKGVHSLLKYDHARIKSYLGECFYFFLQSLGGSVIGRLVRISVVV